MLDTLNDNDMELAVLGSMLIDPDAIDATRAILPHYEAFYDWRNQQVYRAVIELNDKRLPVDMLTLSKLLEQWKVLSEVGGDSYIAQLVNTVPTALNVAGYAEVVRDLWARRRVITGAQEQAQAALDRSIPFGEVVGLGYEKLGIAADTIQRSRVSTGRELFASALDKMEQAGNTTGLKTEMNDLDGLIGYLTPGDFVVVAARPGVGKTAFLLSVILNMLRSGKRVGLYTLEMGEWQVALRLISQMTGFQYQELEQTKKGRGGESLPFDSQDWQVVTRATGQASEFPILVDESPFLTIAQFRAGASKMVAQHGVEIVFLDYLQLLHSDKKSDTRREELAEITRGVKETARALNVPIVAAAQLNRNVEQRADKRPSLSDLAESGTIEQDTDVVAMLYRDEIYNPDTEMKNIAEVIVAKNRRGAPGKAMLFYDGRLMRFNNLSLERIAL